jgi:hypothetical protein
MLKILAVNYFAPKNTTEGEIRVIVEDALEFQAKFSESDFPISVDGFIHFEPRMERFYISHDQTPMTDDQIAMMQEFVDNKLSDLLDLPQPAIDPDLGNLWMGVVDSKTIKEEKLRVIDSLGQYPSSTRPHLYDTDNKTFHPAHVGIFENGSIQFSPADVRPNHVFFYTKEQWDDLVSKSDLPKNLHRAWFKYDFVHDCIIDNRSEEDKMLEIYTELDQYSSEAHLKYNGQIEKTFTDAEYYRELMYMFGDEITSIDPILEYLKFPKVKELKYEETVDPYIRKFVEDFEKFSAIEKIRIRKLNQVQLVLLHMKKIDAKATFGSISKFIEMVKQQIDLIYNS